MLAAFWRRGVEGGLQVGIEAAHADGGRAVAGAAEEGAAAAVDDEIFDGAAELAGDTGADLAVAAEQAQGIADEGGAPDEGERGAGQAGKPAGDVAAGQRGQAAAEGLADAQAGKLTKAEQAAGDAEGVAQQPAGREQAAERGEAGEPTEAAGSGGGAGAAGQTEGTGERAGNGLDDGPQDQGAEEVLERGDEVAGEAFAGLKPAQQGVGEAALDVLAGALPFAGGVLGAALGGVAGFAAVEQGGELAAGVDFALEAVDFADVEAARLGFFEPGDGDLLDGLGEGEVAGGGERGGLLFVTQLLHLVDDALGAAALGFDLLLVGADAFGLGAGFAGLGRGLGFGAGHHDGLGFHHLAHRCGVLLFAQSTLGAQGLELPQLLGVVAREADGLFESLGFLLGGASGAVVSALVAALLAQSSDGLLNGQLVLAARHQPAAQGLFLLGQAQALDAEALQLLVGFGSGFDFARAGGLSLNGALGQALHFLSGGKLLAQLDDLVLGTDGQEAGRAGLAGGDFSVAKCALQRRCRVVLTADVLDRIDSGARYRHDALPRAFDVAELLDDLRRAAFDGGVVGFLSDLGSLGASALLFQRLDLLVQALGEEAGGLVELERGLQRVLAQLGEGLRGFGHCRAADLLQVDGGQGEALDAFGADTPAPGELGQGFGGLALGGAEQIQALGHAAELADREAGLIAREHQRLVELLGLLGAGEEARAQGQCGAGRDGDGVDEAEHVAAQGFGCRARTAEGVLELAALLQKHRERRLAGGQAGGDVGELRRDLAQCRSGCLGRHAHVAQAGGGGGLRGLGLLEAVQVWLEGVAADAALLGDGLEVSGAAAASRLGGSGGALDAGDDGLCSPVELLRGVLDGLGEPIHALAGLLTPPL